MAVGSGVSFASFGLYVAPLEAEFGWARAEVALGFSISLLISGLVAPLVGRAVDAYGPRRVIVLGAPLTAATYLLLATTDALWQWYLFLAINAMVRQLVFYIPFQTLISRWFDRRRGLAVSILGAGLALGSVVMVPIMRVVIDAVGWNGSFLVAGALIAGLVMPLGLLVVRDGPAPVSAGRDREPAPMPALGSTGLTLRQAMRTPLFWVIALALTMLFYGLIGWIVHAVPYYESVGISPGWAAGLVSIAAGGSIVALLALGAVADRAGRMEAVAIGLAVFLSAAMLTLLISGGSVVGVALFVVLFVIGRSGGPLLEPLLLTRAFGVAHFATILGVVFMVETVGLVISPTAAGAIFDATGSYDWALVMFACSAGAACLLFWLAARLPRPTLLPPATPPSAAELRGARQIA